MAQKTPKIQHQLIVIQEGVDDAWIFESQPNVPRIGEEVVMFYPDGAIMAEGRVVNVKWAYLEESHSSSCTVTLRAEKE